MDAVSIKDPGSPFERSTELVSILYTDTQENNEVGLSIFGYIWQVRI